MSQCSPFAFLDFAEVFVMADCCGELADRHWPLGIGSFCRVCRVWNRHFRANIKFWLPLGSFPIGSVPFRPCDEFAASVIGLFHFFLSWLIPSRS